MRRAAITVTFALLAAFPFAGRPADVAPLAELKDEVVYFVMVDRFHNGDPSNDRAGDQGDSDADVLRHGFRPEDPKFYHGGDLKGLTAQLDYIQGLGATALWLTPVMKNRPVQGDGTIARSSAAYHGYWITDFLAVDPHLGTGEDLKALVDAAHARGMRVFLDVIANHTADVIRYRECDAGSCGYRPTDRFPDPAYTAYVPDGLESVKNPAWLNDPGHYHNRGDSFFQGEDSVLGDFYGLDDLKTEDPRVVAGMIDIYRHWIATYGIDGFRVDTVKHVNPEFWQQFVPAIRAFAAEQGKPDFFVFGEAYEQTPAVLSRFTREQAFPAVLDFGFQYGMREAVAQGRGGRPLRDLFAADDLYPDAGLLPTFLGNHDMGRVGRFLMQGQFGASPDELLRRDRLAHGLMMVLRGIPVIYYGDEQGFSGSGGDFHARQDMDPTRVAIHADEAQIGTDATPASDNFDTNHPLYRAIAEFAALRREHPALAGGDQILRPTDPDALFAVSRLRWNDPTEYLVVANLGEEPATATVVSLSAGATFRPVLGLGETLTADAEGRLTLDMPPLDVVVLRAEARSALPTPELTVVVPKFRKAVPGRAEVCVQSSTGAYGEVTLMLVGADGSPSMLGTDRTTVGFTDSDATACPNSRPTYRLLIDPNQLPETGTLRAVWRSPSGEEAVGEAAWAANP